MSVVVLHASSTGPNPGRRNAGQSEEAKAHHSRNHTEFSSALTSEGAPNIIVVDDDREISALFTRILKKAGCNVSKSFSRGKELLDYLEEEVNASSPLPDVVLLDFRMPGLDGLETAKRLRERYPKLKLVLISAYEPPGEGKGYFDAYLNKPVSINELVNTVSVLLGK